MQPGRHFLYNNYNTQLLGLVLERTTGQNVSHYLQEKIWKPNGMQFNGAWSLDSEESGFEQMQSGINARAIDFAKFGRLYLKNGSWNGTGGLMPRPPGLLLSSGRRGKNGILPERWLL
jgi:CubicO group peptidase (beta-lactamase class C family)